MELKSIKKQIPEQLFQILSNETLTVESPNIGRRTRPDVIGRDSLALGYIMKPFSGQLPDRPAAKRSDPGSPGACRT